MSLIERILRRFGYVHQDRVSKPEPVPEKVGTVTLIQSKEVAFKKVSTALDLTSKIEKALLIEMLPDLFSNAMISVSIKDDEKVATYTVTLKVIPASSW